MIMIINVVIGTTSIPNKLQQFLISDTPHHRVELTVITVKLSIASLDSAHSGASSKSALSRKKFFVSPERTRTTVVTKQKAVNFSRGPSTHKSPPRGFALIIYCGLTVTISHEPHKAVDNLTDNSFLNF